MIVVGLDPGTYTTGFFAFNSETKAIYSAIELKSNYPDANNRIWQIAQRVHDALAGCPPPDLICIESTVFNSRGNTTYQKLVGAFVALFSPDFTIVEVSNMVMKKVVGGTGAAEKPEVAVGVGRYFTENQTSLQEIISLINQEQFDVTDAGGVGIAGLKQFEESKNVEVRKTRKANGPRVQRNRKGVRPPTAGG